MSDAPAGTPHPLAELIAGIRRMIPEPAARSETAGRRGDDHRDGDGAEGDVEQWRELATAVDELVEAVLVQQDLIENLLIRMSRLEGRDTTPRAARGA